MKKAIAILAAAAIAAIAGQVWYEVDGKRYNTGVIPYSKLDKNQTLAYGLDCSEPNGKYYKIKNVIYQEKPCFVDGGLGAQRIDDHTVVVYNNEGYYIIGDAFEMDLGEESTEKPIIGDEDCTYEGEEKWTIYYYDNGQWKYGCEGTFIFK